MSLPTVYGSLRYQVFLRFYLLCDRERVTSGHSGGQSERETGKRRPAEQGAGPAVPGRGDRPPSRRQALSRLSHPAPRHRVYVDVQCEARVCSTSGKQKHQTPGKMGDELQVLPAPEKPQADSGHRRARGARTVPRGLRKPAGSDEWTPVLGVTAVIWGVAGWRQEEVLIFKPNESHYPMF